MRLPRRLTQLLLTLQAGVAIGACAAQGTSGARPSSPEPEISRRPEISAYYSQLPIEWSLECGFPEKFAQQASYGFIYWDDLTPSALFVEVPCDTGDIIVTRSMGYYVKKDSPSPSTLGVASSWGTGPARGSLITYYRPWSESTRQLRENTSIHEVGHALGFEHIDREECSMYPYISLDGGRFVNELKPACPDEIAKFLEFYGGR